MIRLSYVNAIGILMILLVNCFSLVQAGSIQSTKHNLSITGSGKHKVSTEDEICKFCHIRHQGMKRMSFRWMAGARSIKYTPYTSSTLHASPGQPTGASRQCLSCHDGTIALGGLVSRPDDIQFGGGLRTLPQGDSNLGTDLSDDHPVSFVYDSGLALSNPELQWPSALPEKIRLDKNNMLQCTACHDPHDNRFDKFLVMSNQYSGLCTACHSIDGWALSSHSVSNARWNGQGNNPWSDSGFYTVAENGCNSCHTSHSAGSKERLLHHKFEEDNCLVCHNSNVSSKNIETELFKQYGHPVHNYTDKHDAAESFVSGRVEKHVECVDCHNSHQVNNSPSAGQSLVAGANKAVKGINSNGQEIAQSLYLYEICFKCHADNNVAASFPVTRQIGQLNTRLEFSAANPSFHPVLSTGKNTDVPSLVPGFSKNSMITCTDCHNTDETSGLKGPHGSRYKFLLERKYNTDDYTAETPFEYDLCYKCHSRSSILNNKSGFLHQTHLNLKAPCSACHDPHGISGAQGNSINNSHLINFDISIVQNSNQGFLYFEDQGKFQGRCFLTCHGKNHNGSGYNEFTYWE